MTRLFNLESCVECYQYARLFDFLPEQLIPAQGDLPKKYKNFLQNHANVAYLSEPVTTHIRSQELEINPSTLDLSVGTQLNEGDDQLFIIRDTVDLMTLATGGFLNNRDSRLYASAYHYWNHISEFSKINLTKPLVIIDLDSFGGDRLIPISFEHPDNSPYPVPILDTRHENLPLKFDAAATYENICHVIARQLLSDRFPSLATDSSTVSHLAHYLQKISFIQYVQLNLAENQEFFNLLVEIFHQGEIFYKNVTVQVSLIQQIILQQINPQQFNHLASQHPKIQFAIVSHYPVLAQMQTQLPDFIIIKSSIQEFRSIWQQKREGDFHLFGFYLDKIEFAVEINDEERWIQLSNQNEENIISYEGDKRRIKGFIPNSAQDYFVIKPGTTSVTLPIRVNGQSYHVNKVAQDYYIEVGDRAGSENLKVGIEFNLQPDSPPEIIAINFNDQSRLKCELGARQTSTYRYIPYRRIAKTRQRESNKQINRLQLSLSNFRAALLQITQNLQCRVVNYDELANSFREAYEQIHHRRSSELDPLQFIKISTDDNVVASLLEIIESTGISVISELMARWLTEYGNTKQVFRVNQSRTSLGNILKYAILFLGKTYHFSQRFTVENLFSAKLLGESNNLDFSNDYIIMLARVAVIEELQRQYFGYFTATYGNRIAYQSDIYLWGYWRILRWYFDYRHSNNWFDYRNQFKLIIKYLLEVDTSQSRKDYKINAFSSLIYLLSFQEVDSDFCRTGSEEMRMAAEVIEHFKNDRTIKSRQVSEDTLLNEYFEQLIAGIATESGMKALLRAG